MFTLPLFTIAKIWKQLKCPLTDEWNSHHAKLLEHSDFLCGLALVKQNILPVKLRKNWIVSNKAYLETKKRKKRAGNIEKNKSLIHSLKLTETFHKFV